MQPYPPPIRLHKHDGFFLRFGLGVGYFSSSGTISVSGGPESKYKVKGTGLALDISIGGAIASGVILAGTITATSASNATQSADGYPDYSSSASLSALGVLVDVYPNPTDGLHFGGALSLAGVSYNDTRNNSSDDTRQGGAISGHFGYEWWVGTDWSLGVMGRITYAHATRRIDTALGTTTSYSLEYKDSVVSPALLFVGTYN
jgi:hypothetical protein